VEVEVGVLDLQLFRLHYHLHLALFNLSPFLARAACLPNPLLKRIQTSYISTAPHFSALLPIGKEVSPPTRTSTSDHARGHSGDLAHHLL